MVQAVVDELQHRSNLERFGEIGDRAGQPEPARLFRGRIRAQDRDRNRAQERILPEAMEDFLARQVGQVQVEKNEIGPPGLRGGETGP